LTEDPGMAHSVLAAPLIYRRKVLGVLAVANGAMSTPFTQSDVKVFQAIAEQSAFALYTETVYLEANEKKRIDHELEIAREIQSVLLPARAPDFPGFELGSVNIPARGVSGDYLDFLELPGGRLGVAIADVSGKGVPAALIMAMCRSAMRSEAAQTASPAEVLRRVNSQLYPDIKEDMFISMAYLILDSGSGTAILARAGHDAPLLCRAEDRRVEKVSPRGMAVGIDSGEVFNRVIEDFEFSLSPGDCLLFYTDGATEALDGNGLEFGVGRLAQCLQAAAPRGARQVVLEITEEIRSFVGSQPKHDDVTLIALKKT
ncbi:MAG: SpoIIE family protein phosphatase, partial [Terrimicrobiaceae bacterium]|nr:SpoIIE family protein phosphatase [Terrimicrobiaceae bacterium]